MRVAAVIHRYGEQIVGGESLCRQLMERFSRRLDVTVLTTTAEDYVTWAEAFPPGPARINGVPVLRFPVERQRTARFHWLSRLVLSRPYRTLPLTGPLRRRLESLWIDWQGPYSPALLRYLREHGGDYQGFIFYGYLYYPTVRGLPLVRAKSILVPFAHEERPIHLGIFRRLFAAAPAFVFMTGEEEALVDRLFRVQERPCRIASLKIPVWEELAPEHSSPAAVESFRARHSLQRPYFLYLGRLDPAKGVDWMLRRFETFRRARGHDCLLVMAGRAHMSLPDLEGVRYIGYLSESDKQLAILGSIGLIVPSPYESLSIALLEGFGLKRAAIVNGASPVLAGHIRRSGGGFSVEDDEGFGRAAEALLRGCPELGEAACRYVRREFGWSKVEQGYADLLGQVSSRGASGEGAWPSAGEADSERHVAGKERTS